MEISQAHREAFASYAPPSSPESTAPANVMWARRTARIKLASEFCAVRISGTKLRGQFAARVSTAVHKTSTWVC